MKRALVLLLCACGDNRPEIEVFEPTNGTRLTIEQYQFDDGTRLVQPTAFYDRHLHARCTPQEWIDGVTRCVPDAEEAYFREETCTTLVGVGNTIEHATHFLTYDVRDDRRYPASAFAATTKIDPIDRGFRRDGEMCVPAAIDVSDKTIFWELGDELDGDDLVAITETEIGDGRLGLVVRHSDDGALVPLGFRDRVLDTACKPIARRGGGACAPIGAAEAIWFADNACTQPALIASEAEPPAVATTPGDDGCPVFRAALSTTAPRAYRDTGTGCVSVPTMSPVLLLGPPVDLAAVTRDVETAAKRRVQRILASEGDLHVYSDRMLDTAIGAECELAKVGKALRCLPTSLAPIARLFHPGCTVERRLAEVVAKSCEPMAFAVNDTGDTLELHAVGDPIEGTAFTLLPSGECMPYTPPTGSVLHDVGPILPDDTFIGAIPFGAR